MSSPDSGQAETLGPLGILGGTFDPFHCAHLQLASDACAQLGLSELKFIPAGNPPLRSAPLVTAVHRLAMVRAAIGTSPQFSVDDSETKLGSPSYTVETLARLRQELGMKRSLVLLLGTDAFARLPQWHRWRELFALAHVAVATRPGYNSIESGIEDADLATELSHHLGTSADLTQAPAGRIIPFAMTPLDLSATNIRQRLAQGLDVSALVPAPVLDYIQTHQLYRTVHGH